LRTATADSTVNLWQTLQAAQWKTVDGSWPSAITATAAGGDVQLPRQLITLLARVSPFTAPFWVQLLANTQRLVPADAASYQVNWLSGPPLGNSPQFKVLDALGGEGTWGIDSKVKAVETGSDVAFARVLLLTQKVRDVTGQLGPERYLGLYYLGAGNTFFCQHRSPALPAVTEECTINPLTLRVVEVQIRITAIDSATLQKGYFPRLDFWADIFGDPKNPDTAGASDSVARIVGVSAPVSLSSRTSAPVITTISPTKGARAGGTTMTITGSGFTFAASVQFGSTSVSSMVINSDSQITVVIPAGTGTVDIVVVSLQGSSAAAKFAYQ
jgi:IPT/TIG domain